MHHLGVAFLFEHFIVAHGQSTDVLAVLKALARLRRRELLTNWRRYFIFQSNGSFLLISLSHQILASGIPLRGRRRRSLVQMKRRDLQLALSSITRCLLQVLLQ